MPGLRGSDIDLFAADQSIAVAASVLAGKAFARWNPEVMRRAPLWRKSQNPSSDSGRWLRSPCEGRLRFLLKGCLFAQSILLILLLALLCWSSDGGSDMSEQTSIVGEL